MASLKDLEAKMRRMGPAIIAATDETLREHADFLAERAQANAPVQSGTLQASIHVEKTGSEKHPAYDVVADAPYALAVHERSPDQDHAHTHEVTPEGYPGRKYLSRPLHSHAPRLQKALGAAHKAAMESA